MGGKKKDRRNHADALWWNEEVKDAISENKVMQKKICVNRSKENKVR